MENARYFPYVESRTLDRVVAELQNREALYLREIVAKIERENGILIPLVWPASRRHLEPSTSSVVYELLSLSSNNSLPRVTKSTEGKIKNIVRERITVNPNPLESFGDIINMVYRENENVITFLNLAVLAKQHRGIFIEGLTLYWLIREQARKNRIASN